MQWSDKTKYSYVKAYTVFFEWLQRNSKYTVMMSENEFKSNFTINSFLDFLCLKKKYGKDTNTNNNLSYNGLNRFRCGLKYYLKQKNIILSEYDDAQLSDFLKVQSVDFSEGNKMEKEK